MTCCNTNEYGYTSDDFNNEQQEHKNWNTRNNSANISGVLNSELYNSEEEGFNGSRKHVVVSNNCYKTCRLPKFFCDGCYCRKKPVFPKLAINRPEQQFKRLKKPKCKFMGQTYCRNGCQCNVNHDGSYSTETLESNLSPEYNKLPEDGVTKVKKTNAEPKKPIPTKQSDGAGKPLKNVKQLQVRNQYNAQQANKQLKSENSNAKKPVKNDTYSVSKNKNKSLQVHTNIGFDSTLTRNSQTKNDNMFWEDINDCDLDIISDVNTNTGKCENLKNLNTFRNENYFDCFSTANLCDEKGQDHKCVYTFLLNDRWIPQPLYADGFGTSRCTQCDKPMKSDVLHSSKPNTITKPITKYHTNVSKKMGCCVGHQSKHKINISAKNDRIEIKVPMSSTKYNDLFNTYFKIKNPTSANSLALRHQKGVV